MNKKRLSIFGIILLFGFGSFYIYNKVLYKEGRNVGQETSAFVLPASGLISQYKSDVAGSDKKYLNKTIEIEGKITEISDSAITLDSTVFCGFDKKANPKNQNGKVRIKGRCIGFDEMFNEVKFDQCIILE